MRHKSWLFLLSTCAGIGALVLIGVFFVYEELKASQAERALSRFTPSEDSARSALEAALRSWAKGDQPGTIARLDSPQVVLVDTCRRPGQTLDRFTILGEAAGDGPRCFAARVKLRNPDEEQRLRFVVFGVDPLWVYRCEDYEMMIRWQCGQAEREGGSASSPALAPSAGSNGTIGSESKKKSE